jgi:hypothetical protein
MGSLKDQALENTSEGTTTHELTEQEMSYLRLLNKTLVFHTYGSNIQSGFLYYVSTNRLGYAQGTDLQFEIDLEKEDNLLTVKLLPVESPAPPIDK